MRRFSTIVLLLSISVMNMNVLCQSLCMTGHDDMADVHASHKPAKHEMSKGDICPITHNATHDSHQSEHAMPQESIECDCSIDQLIQLAANGFELTLTESSDVIKPHSYFISKVHSSKNIFLNNEPIPLEGPPKLVPDRDQGILS